MYMKPKLRGYTDLTWPLWILMGRRMHHFGPSMLAGTTHSSNCSAVRNPEATAASFRVRPFLWACFAIFAALSYPILLLSAVTSMRELLTSALMFSMLGLIPTTQLVVKDFAPSASRRIDCRQFAAIIGLKTLSSKWPLEPATDTAVWLPITWAAIIVRASHCVGLTLPGMIELPGSFSG